MSARMYCGGHGEWLPCKTCARNLAWPLTADRAKVDLDLYTKSMVAGNLNTCIAIEQRYGLHGYPPELVSVGLNAAAEGLDAEEAVSAHIEASEFEARDHFIEGYDA